MSDVLEDLSRRAAQTQVWVDPTRSKPPPWFVGNGRGLMVAVLLVIAALVLARVVSTIWLVEAAWTWSHERLGRQDAVKPPAPHGPIAIDLQSWVTQADYPVKDEYAHREGTTIVELGVDPSGRLTNCWIEGTSGSGYLDHAACDAIEARARFLPARDDKGDAVAALVRKRIVWKAPPQPVLEIEPYDGLRIFDRASGNGAGACRQFYNGVEAPRPDCTVPPELLKHVARATGATTFRMAGRSRTQIADTAPTALPPLPAPNRPVFALTVRATIEPDGRLVQCTGTLHEAGKERRAPTPCDTGRRMASQRDSDGRPVQRYLLWEDRVSAVPR